MKIGRRKWIILLSGGVMVLAIGIIAIGSYIILNRPAKPETYQDYIRQAEEYAESGDLTQAAGSYWKAVEIDSTSTAAYLGLGKIYEKKSDQKHAIAVYEAGARNTGAEELEKRLEEVQKEETAEEIAAVSTETAEPISRISDAPSTNTKESQEDSAAMQPVETEGPVTHISSIQQQTEEPQESEDMEEHDEEETEAEENADYSEQTLRVSGIVTIQDGTPVDGAEVILISEMTDTIECTTETDENGLYTVYPVTSGEYILQVTKEGFEETQERICVSEQDVQWNILLASEDTAEETYEETDTDLPQEQQLEQESENAEADLPQESEQRYRISGTIYSAEGHDCIRDAEVVLIPEEPDDEESDLEGLDDEESNLEGLDDEESSLEGLDDGELDDEEENNETADREEYTVVTDENGAYLLEDVRAGEYTLEVTASGFEKAQETVTITDADVEMDIALITLEDIPGEE